LTTRSRMSKWKDKSSSYRFGTPQVKHTFKIKLQAWA
jgi:hypothetical protein